MPKHAFISIPLDIPDVRVLQTELTKAGERILTISIAALHQEAQSTKWKPVFREYIIVTDRLRLF